VVHEVEVVYSEALVQDAVRCFYRRRIRELFDFKFVVAGILTVTGMGWLAWHDEYSWLLAFCVGALGVCALFLVWAYLAQYRGSIGRLRQMKEPKARFIFGDSDLTVSSDLGSSTVYWSAITDLWQFPDFWLLLTSRASFLTFPTQGVSQPVLAYVRSKVAGGAAA